MTIIKAHNATEFLALIPQMIGYTPTNSIVIIPFTGNRTTGALRLDIPSDNQRNALINLAISLIARIDRADGITIAIYAEEHTTHAALAAALVTAFNRAGYTIHDTLYATGEGGGTYGHEPAPLPTNTPGDQHTGATLPHVPTERAQAIQAATKLNTLTPLPTADDTEHLFTVIDHALAVAPENMDAADAAQLIRLLTTPALRDVAIATWCHGTETGQTTLPQSPLILAGEGGRPDATRLQRASALTRYLAATTTDARERAALLATAAWIAWALGAGTAADDLATAALAAEDHGLATIVQQLARQGVLPEWSFPT